MFKGNMTKWPVQKLAQVDIKRLFKYTNYG